MSDSANKCSIFESTGGGAQSYFVDECPHYWVNFVQFRYCWDWRSCQCYGIRRFPHSSGFDHAQTDVNTLGTKRSICLQYHRWPLFRGFHKAGSTVFGGKLCLEGSQLYCSTCYMLTFLVTLYQTKNYSTCTCLLPQMTPIKTTFELQNYYLSGYVSVLNDMEV